MKYVVVSGGVVSGLGKGITSSSIGLLLKSAGVRVTAIKIDPYLNTDAGTMSPYEHGEVYVLKDGGEVDLDLGNYERFMDIELTRDHNITTGKVYQKVIDRERKGDYLGKTVQVVPHVTTQIQEWIERVAAIPVDGTGKQPEVCLIELGGTVGDIESMVFLEALRQFRFRVGADNFFLVHVTLVPVVSSVGEPKTKPTQHGVRELMAAGMHPDLIVCRSTKPLTRSIISKISLFCMVPATHVLGVHDVSNLYRVPLLLHKQRVADLILGRLKFNRMPAHHLPQWEELARRVDECKSDVTIGIVGKYTGLSDSYLSVTKALKHAAMAHELCLKVVWLESTDLEEEMEFKDPARYAKAWDSVKTLNGILIPGGFGSRGIDGKIRAIRHARENNIPFLGICYGFQMAVVEYARSVLEMKDANSEEVDADTEDPVVTFMPEVSKEHMGGTMRLGLRKAILSPNTLAWKLYDEADSIEERHRHRYEVNPEYIQRLTSKGLVFSGKDGVRMECLELPDHKFFFATQFHPEFLSRPLRPSPPFLGFVEAAAGITKLPVFDAKAKRRNRKKKKKKKKTGDASADSATSSASTTPAASAVSSPTAAGQSSAAPSSSST